VTNLPSIGLRLATGFVLAATLVVGASACGSSGKKAAATSSSPSSTATTVTETAGIDTLEGASTKPVSAPAKVKETALLEKVSVARHEGYDRIVLQFKNGLPGYTIKYVDPPLRQDGSGEVVKIAGKALVHIRMEPASSFDLSKAEGEMVYKGPRRISAADAGTSVIREAVQVSDFEAVLSWGVGLDDRVDFRVLTLENPARLVIDFRNH
jgi:hypothetical protein